MERLIRAVQEYPVLYDTSHEDYAKTKVKDEIWSKIAEELNYPKVDRSYPELGEHFEGDIIQLPERNAMKIEEYLWPGGVVPYIFHKAFTQDERQKIEVGMRGLEKDTCVKFVPRSTEDTDYIKITKRPRVGCGAMVGRRPGRGAMPVNYEAPNCLMQTGIIQHELLHVLGLFHEQTRPDRDDYIVIHWENIIPEYKINFAKAPEEAVTTYNVPYDYKSLMHYPRHAFSKNGKETIVAKNDTSLELGQHDGPSWGDLEKIRRLYSCSSPAA